MKSHLVLAQHDLRQATHAVAHSQPAAWSVFKMCGLVPLLLLGPNVSLAEPIEVGRLFYTPTQRAQLETARTRNVTQLSSPNKQDKPVGATAPQRYDGVVIRSDGQSTRWVDGKAEVGPSSVKGLKPGQIRANGKVYEPYQVLRPEPSIPADPEVKKATP